MQHTLWPGGWQVNSRRDDLSLVQGRRRGAVTIMVDDAPEGNHDCFLTRLDRFNWGTEPWGREHALSSVKPTCAPYPDYRSMIYIMYSLTNVHR